jgi:hypothetical protein
MLEVGEDCTITSGPLPVTFGFAVQGNFFLTSQATPIIGVGNYFPFGNRFVIPATVLATSFDGYVSAWTDFGNGILAPFANALLLAGLNVAQSTSVVNPTWTIVSNQWEAITIGFKTRNAAGAFRLVSMASNSTTVSTLTVSSNQTLPQSTVIIIWRTTNSVTGIPVMSVSANTAGDVYVASAVTTNASDGTNGSSMGVLSTASSAGSASNTITISATNSPVKIEMVILEYQYAGVVDAALVGATGNSAAPASGNYTPATAGDLIISAMATNAALGTVPTVGSGFMIRAINAGQGTIAVADNFGNGALATGAINVICVGTEE